MIEFLRMRGVSLLDFWLSFRPKPRPLVFTDCKVLTDNFTPASCFEVLNVCVLNNTHGFGSVTIELAFNPINVDYGRFYMKYLSLKTSNDFAIKIDKLANFKDFVLGNYTKVNKNGELILAVKYFFASAEEKEKFLSSDSFVFEGFLAIKSRRNTYGFISKFIRQESDWKLLEGNTYRIYHGVNLNNLFH